MGKTTDRETLEELAKYGDEEALALLARRPKAPMSYREEQRLTEKFKRVPDERKEKNDL